MPMQVSDCREPVPRGLDRMPIWHAGIALAGVLSFLISPPLAAQGAREEAAARLGIEMATCLDAEVLEADCLLDGSFRALKARYDLLPDQGIRQGLLLLLDRMAERAAPLDAIAAARALIASSRQAPIREKETRQVATAVFLAEVARRLLVLPEGGGAAKALAREALDTAEDYLSAGNDHLEPSEALLFVEAYAWLGETARAEAWIERFVRVGLGNVLMWRMAGEPTDVKDAQWRLVNAEAAIGESEAALQRYDALIGDLSPSDALAAGLDGRVAVALAVGGDLTAGQRLLPENLVPAIGHAELALLLAGAGKDTEARTLLRESEGRLGTAPAMSRVPVLRRLARAWLALGDRREALRIADGLLAAGEGGRLDRRLASSYQGLGDDLVQAGAFERARRAYRLLGPETSGSERQLITLLVDDLEQGRAPALDLARLLLQPRGDDWLSRVVATLLLTEAQASPTWAVRPEAAAAIAALTDEDRLAEDRAAAALALMDGAGLAAAIAARPADLTLARQLSQAALAQAYRGREEAAARLADAAAVAWRTVVPSERELVTVARLLNGAGLHRAALAMIVDRPAMRFAFAIPVTAAAALDPRYRATPFDEAQRLYPLGRLEADWERCLQVLSGQADAAQPLPAWLLLTAPFCGAMLQ